MFYQGYSLLMNHVRTDALPLPRAAGSRAACAESDLRRAMSRELGTMKLSERLRDPDGYRRLQRARREVLEALLAAPSTRETAARAVDVLCMIAEESTWSDNASGAPFDDDSHPEIDLACAETAVLLGWTCRILGERLGEISPRIASRLLAEVRRRVFTPALVHEDYPFMTGEGACPTTICSDILLAALMLETDSSRLSRVVKAMLRRMDECCGRHGRAPAPLVERITDIAAATDLASLLRHLTRGEFDLSSRIPADEWLDEILFSWIEKGWFVDPAGDGHLPAVSGGDVFRVGLAADDGALTALGAQIFRQNRLAPRTVTGRMLDLSACALLEAEDGRPPKMRYAATHRNHLMTARLPGLYFALHTGGNRANAGDLCLFADGKPLLVDGGARCPAGNLPVLAGRRQLPAPEIPCAADFEAQEDRETLSIELTHAYPPECRLRSYQRSALMLRGEQMLRVVEMLSFDAPAAVVFSFVTPANPAVDASEILLGPVRMTWEGEFTVCVRPLEDGLICLEMTAVEPVAQALFAFNFEHT